MTARRGPLPAPARRRRGALRGAALALLLSLPLAGCMPVVPEGEEAAQDNLQGLIVLATAIDNVDRIDPPMLEEIEHQSRDLIRAFRSLHPRVRVEVQPFLSSQVPQELARRSRDGLAPDLLLVSGADARSLDAQGLIRPLTMPRELGELLSPQALAGVRRSDGRLLGLPLMLQPQLACFNRHRLGGASPEDWPALLNRSRHRLRVGLPMDALNLAWTLRPLGGLSSVQSLAAGHTPTAAERWQLQHWLEALRQAQRRDGIRFLASQDALVQGLVDGELDWVSCRSNHLDRLRQRGLLPHLGVALLPSGAGGDASPINRDRVLVFGTNSTPAQRQAAEALARFGIHPLVQRRIESGTLGLPVAADPLPVTDHASLRGILKAAMAQGSSPGAGAVALQLNSADNANRFRHLMMDFLYGELSSREASDRLVTLLQGKATP